MSEGALEPDGSDSSLKWIKYNPVSFVPTESSFMEGIEWWHGEVNNIERIYYFHFPKEGDEDPMSCMATEEASGSGQEAEAGAKGKPGP